MLLLPIVGKLNLRLNQSLKAFKDQYTKGTEMLGTAPALPRGKSCLTMPGCCPWEHLPQTQTWPGNKPPDRRICELNTIFLI